MKSSINALVIVLNGMLRSYINVTKKEHTFAI